MSAPPANNAASPVSGKLLLSESLSSLASKSTLTITGDQVNGFLNVTLSTNIYLLCVFLIKVF